MNQNCKVFVALTITAACLFSTPGFAKAQADQAASSSHSSDENISNRTLVPTGRYITGGVMGSILGYGIGHAIQGRFSDKGWIFTTTGVISTLAIVNGLNSCTTTDYYGSSRTSCTNTSLILVGYMSLIGFHVWEIVDLWSGAKPFDPQQSSAYILPTKDGVNIGYVYRF